MLLVPHVSPEKANIHHIHSLDNQGMSDLLSPLLFVMKNEVDAFWCFVGFMDRVASNFEFDQVGL